MWCSGGFRVVSTTLTPAPEGVTTYRPLNCRAMPFDKLKPYLSDRPLRRWKEQ
jgi:hypothetical protein